MVQNKIYIVLVTLLFAAFALVLNLFPRSAYSPLEKRELARFPEFSLDSLFSGAFTTSINSWYSDSEPFRDRFMQLSMKEKDLLRVVLGEENVTFHAAAGPVEEGEETDDLEMKERNVEEYHNNLTADEKAKIANKGIIIVGSGPNVRALMAYGGSSKGGVQYAEAANEYKRAFGSSVKANMLPRISSCAPTITGRPWALSMPPNSLPAWPAFPSSSSAPTSARSFTVLWAACTAIPRTSP